MMSVRRFRAGLVILASASAILALTLQATSVAGTKVDTRQLVAKLEARYRSSRTTQATFLENYTENGRLVRSEAGVVYFRKPGKMRWEYQSPEKNLFLVDGKLAWFYVPADHTVTRVPAKRSDDWRTPLALLAGEMKLSRVCATVESVSERKPVLAADAVLRCGLRESEPDVESESPPVSPTPTSVFLDVNPLTGELDRIQIQDPGGVGIEFRFENWSFGLSLPDSFFQFSPPLGVAIVNGELPVLSKNSH